MRHKTRNVICRKAANNIESHAVICFIFNSLYEVCSPSKSNSSARWLRLTLLHRLRLVNQTPRRQANGFGLFPGKVLEIPGSEVEIVSESDQTQTSGLYGKTPGWSRAEERNH